MNYSEEELQKMSYRELQEVAKEEDINATGTQEELLENLKNNLTESDPKSKFEM